MSLYNTKKHKYVAKKALRCKVKSTLTVTTTVRWIFIAVITTVVITIAQPLPTDTASIAAGTWDVSMTTRRRSCKTTVMLTGVVQHSLAFVHAVTI